jgi:hypothetical protein
MKAADMERVQKLLADRRHLDWWLIAGINEKLRALGVEP